MPEVDELSIGPAPDAALTAGVAIPPTLRAFALAAVAARASYAGASETPEIQFLIQHLEAVSTGRPSWRDALPDYLERPHPSDAPLFSLARTLRLTTIEMLAVALCAAVEDDVMVGRALAHMQAPIGGSRPTVGLLAAVFGESAEGGPRLPQSLINGTAVDSGLLNVLGDPAPMPERTLAVPQHLTLALADRDGSCPGMVIGLGDLPELALPASLLEEARRQAMGLDTGSQHALIVRTGSKAEGRAVAVAIAAAYGHRPVFIDTDKTPGLSPWAILRGLLPVFCVDLGPGERRQIPSVPCYRGPVMVLCGPDGSVESPSGPALSWSLPVPPRAERERLWREAIGDQPLATDLARDHRHGTGRIFHVGRLARHHAALNGRAAPARDDVLVASWNGEGAGLEGLAYPLKAAVPDDALVTPPALRHRLELLLQRCRARDQLVDGLGSSITARYHPGVRTLFVGPSGTGKTLAAAWLATRLGLPIYRVDLATVTSKYIGETEKNLAQLLARAEQSEIVLLFDEADSLFGKRTDVRDANDRFANAQTNYLLQRIESFDGICILTSNSRSRFDAAFSRRLDVIVEFAMPGPEERKAIWQSHLGTRHSLEPRDFNQLAVAADVSGGEIRNAVLTAAVAARHAGRPLAYQDVVEGLAGEYRKLGRQLPSDLARID